MNARLPAGYRLRPAVSEDLPVVAELLATADRAEHGETTLGEAFLRSEWDRPRFDLATDTAVIEAQDGSMAGYGEAFDEDLPDTVEGMGIVHPAHRARGVGETLLRAQERRADAQLRRISGDRVLLRTVVSGTNAAAAHLVGANGYRRVRSFFHMEVDLADVPSGATEPAPPPGIEHRGFLTGQDEPALHAVLQEAFRGQWGHVERSFEDWWPEKQASGFDAGLCFVAVAGGKVVGVVEGREFEDHGWINELGVLPEWRGRGIGTLLLRLAFAELGRRGHRRALLNVDSENEAGAVGVYGRVGMRVRRRWDLHEKEIR